MPVPGSWTGLRQTPGVESPREYRARVVLSAERAGALAKLLREARADMELTQVALANAAGLTAEHIQKLERGVGSPTLASVYALADALKRPICDLLPR